jgi:cob(I)alamin adenosyltransferase
MGVDKGWHNRNHLRIVAHPIYRFIMPTREPDPAILELARAIARRMARDHYEQAERAKAAKTEADKKGYRSEQE